MDKGKKKELIIYCDAFSKSFVPVTANLFKKSNI